MYKKRSLLLSTFINDNDCCINEILKFSISDSLVDFIKIRVLTARCADCRPVLVSMGTRKIFQGVGKLYQELPEGDDKF